MARLDRVVALVLVAIGVGQVGATPFFFPVIQEPAAWFAAGGLLLTLVGALNLLRITYGKLAPGVRYVSIAANFSLSILWLLMASFLWYKFARYPAAIAVLVLLVFLPLLSLRK